jgi:hypothetical protein
MARGQPSSRGGVVVSCLSWCPLPDDVRALELLARGRGGWGIVFLSEMWIRLVGRLLMAPMKAALQFKRPRPQVLYGAVSVIRRRSVRR